MVTPPFMTSNPTMAPLTLETLNAIFADIRKLLALIKHGEISKKPAA
jgi:hypothetical protein